MVPWVMNKNPPKKAKKKDAAQGEQAETAAREGPKTFHRYYHLYRKGELERDIERAGGEVVEAGYEKDNWWAIMKPKQRNHSS